jgi:hypothetical protein
MNSFRGHGSLVVIFQSKEFSNLNVLLKKMMFEGAFHCCQDAELM